jgi:pyruvate/2-oxoglutarate dehydrogenase complex dihydrolipoamide acyltransferase (E2) component
VKPGDTVDAEDSLVTLESDKATMDVPSPAAGVVKEVQVKLGDKVSEGSLDRRARVRGRRRRREDAPPLALPQQPCRQPAAAPQPRRHRSHRPKPAHRRPPVTHRGRCDLQRQG